MRCEKNGMLLVHYMEHASGPAQITSPDGKHTIINTDHLIEGSWKDGDIDYIIACDKYQCPTCGYEILTGFAREPAYAGVHPQELLKKRVKLAAQRDTLVVLSPRR